jgi:hypothetical protein
MAEIKGITQNECNFQGRVAEDPTFFDLGNGQGAIFRVVTYVPQLGANGQWTDHKKLVTIINMNPTKTENTIKKWVKAGKEVLVRAYYDTWEQDGAEQSGLIMTMLKLGGGTYVDG